MIPALALLRQLLGGLTAGAGATTPALPAWVRAGLIGVGLSVAAFDHIEIAIAKKKGIQPMNLDQALSKFKEFLTEAAGTEEAAVEILTGKPADAPPAVDVHPGVAQLVAAAGPAPVEVPAADPGPVPTDPAPLDPAPVEAAPAAPPALATGSVEVAGVVQTFDDIVRETLDALRLVDTPDQVAKLHAFGVKVAKMVGAL